MTEDIVGKCDICGYDTNLIATKIATTKITGGSIGYAMQDIDVCEFCNLAISVGAHSAANGYGQNNGIYRVISVVANKIMDRIAQLEKQKG